VEYLSHLPSAKSAVGHTLATGPWSTREAKGPQPLRRVLCCCASLATSPQI
jgi:hypothetical protein